MYHTEEKSFEIRQIIVQYIFEHWEEFSTTTYNENGHNQTCTNVYCADLSSAYINGGLCELLAAGKHFLILI